MASGAVTSGMGYALWYRVLPKLTATRPSIVQLTVPVVAGIGGLVFLAEPLTFRFVLASALILGGVAISILINDNLLPHCDRLNPSKIFKHRDQTIVTTMKVKTTDLHEDISTKLPKRFKEEVPICIVIYNRNVAISVEISQ